MSIRYSNCQLIIFDQSNQTVITGVQVTKNNIRKAIHNLKENSTIGPDGIPTIILQKTKIAITKQMRLMLRQSLDERSKAEIHKNLPIYYWYTEEDLSLCGNSIDH